MITYYKYHDFAEKLFFGVALTNEHMNEATIKIANYLCSNGAFEIVNALGIGIVEFRTGEKVTRRRICYKLSGKELTVTEIMNIGLFLPYGANYGRYNMPKLECD